MTIQCTYENRDDPNLTKRRSPSVKFGQQTRKSLFDIDDKNSSIPVSYIEPSYNSF